MEKLKKLFMGIISFIWHIFKFLGEILLLLFQIARELPTIILREAKQKKLNDSEFLKIGLLLFSDYKKEFENFYNSFLKKDEFKAKFDILYDFANLKNLIYSSDWAEEEWSEVEFYIDELLKQKQKWTNAKEFRSNVEGKKLPRGKFIIDLFKSVDKDLQTINKKLIFFRTNGDLYEYSVINIEKFNEIIEIAPVYFYGTEELKF